MKTIFVDGYGSLRIGWIVAIIILATSATCGLVFGVIFAADERSCDEIGIATGHEVEWGVFTGCLVNVNGKEIPKSSWINNEGN